MPPSDRELPETLDLIARLVASISDRLDAQGEALAKLTQAQAQAHDRIEPNRIAAATARDIRETLVPELHRIVGAMEDLNGTKALLRQRLRAASREESRASWWRRHVPFAATLAGAYALVLVFGLALPRLLAERDLTCWAIGGTWWEATERYPAACMFSTSQHDQTAAS